MTWFPEGSPEREFHKRQAEEALLRIFRTAPGLEFVRAKALLMPSYEDFDLRDALYRLVERRLIFEGCGYRYWPWPAPDDWDWRVRDRVMMARYELGPS